MCGIFGYVGNRTDAPELTLVALKTLEYRGYDSWGIAALQADGIHVDRHVGKISGATTNLKASSIAIGHTRWATHGGVTEANAHPHCSCDKKIAVVHNGIVENFQTLKSELLTDQHTFTSQTDTEVIVHLIEQLLKTHEFAVSVRMAFERLHGLNAIVVMNSESREIVAVKNGSPLLVARSDEGLYICSDVSGVISHTDKICYIADHEMVVVSSDSATITNLKDGTSRPATFETVHASSQVVDKGAYAHFLEKEIHEQPTVLNVIATTGADKAASLASAIRSAKGTFFVGCGTAGYACMAGAYFFSRIAKEHINYTIASEFEYLLDYVNKKTLVVPISQSGETIDVVESVNQARLKGARVAVVTNVGGSTLDRMADESYLLGAGLERAVISTKAYMAMVAMLLYSAYSLDGRADEGKKVLGAVVDSVSAILQKSSIENIRSIATGLRDVQHMYILGRGSSYPVAMEFALKIKETTYIHAEGFAGGELKHGVIALVESGTPVIVLAPCDETYEEIISNAQEVKARGARIIGVSPVPSEVFDEYIKVPEAGEGTSLASVVAGQLLAYHIALAKGFEDPDKPRNLAKSVTVK